MKVRFGANWVALTVRASCLIALLEVTIGCNSLQEHITDWTTGPDIGSFQDLSSDERMARLISEKRP